MHERMITFLLLIVGLINILPVMGLFSTVRMEALYGITIAEANLEILMRHRALLFGLVGAFILIAAFRPALQPAALVLAFISMLGFILIAWQTGGYNSGIGKVMLVDWVGLAALLPAIVLSLVKSH